MHPPITALPRNTFFTFIFTTHSQEASPANIAPWARAELAFSAEFEEFNDYILNNADRLVKQMPKEVRVFCSVVFVLNNADRGW